MLLLILISWIGIISGLISNTGFIMLHQNNENLHLIKENDNLRVKSVIDRDVTPFKFIRNGDRFKIMVEDKFLCMDSNFGSVYLCSNNSAVYWKVHVYKNRNYLTNGFGCLKMSKRVSHGYDVVVRTCLDSFLYHWDIINASCEDEPSKKDEKRPIPSSKPVKKVEKVLPETNKGDSRRKTKNIPLWTKQEQGDPDSFKDIFNGFNNDFENIFKGKSNDKGNTSFDRTKNERIGNGTAGKSEKPFAVTSTKYDQKKKPVEPKVGLPYSIKKEIKNGNREVKKTPPRVEAPKSDIVMHPSKKSNFIPRSDKVASIDDTKIKSQIQPQISKERPIKVPNKRQLIAAPDKNEKIVEVVEKIRMVKKTPKVPINSHNALPSFTKKVDIPPILVGDSKGQNEEDYDESTGWSGDLQDNKKKPSVPKQKATINSHKSRAKDLEDFIGKNDILFQDNDKNNEYSIDPNILNEENENLTNKWKDGFLDCIGLACGNELDTEHISVDDILKGRYDKKLTQLSNIPIYVCGFDTKDHPKIKNIEFC